MRAVKINPILESVLIDLKHIHLLGQSKQVDLLSVQLKNT